MRFSRFKLLITCCKILIIGVLAIVSFSGSTYAKTTLSHAAFSRISPVKKDLRICQSVSSLQKFERTNHENSNEVFFDSCGLMHECQIGSNSQNWSGRSTHYKLYVDSDCGEIEKSDFVLYFNFTKATACVTLEKVSHFGLSISPDLFTRDIAGEHALYTLHSFGASIILGPNTKVTEVDLKALISNNPSRGKILFSKGVYFANSSIFRTKIKRTNIYAQHFSSC